MVRAKGLEYKYSDKANIVVSYGFIYSAYDQIEEIKEISNRRQGEFRYATVLDKLGWEIPTDI